MNLSQNSHQSILSIIDSAFQFTEKPSPGFKREHCDECTECYDYIVKLNPNDVTVEDIQGKWQFGHCGTSYRLYLFPGICRECLSTEPENIEFLFDYIDEFDIPKHINRSGNLNQEQYDGITALYQYLFDCGLGLEDQWLHQKLRKRLKTMKCNQDKSPPPDSSISPSN